MNESKNIFKECPSYKKIIKNKSIYKLICDFVTNIKPFHIEEIHLELYKALQCVKGIATDEKHKPTKPQKDFLDAYGCLMKIYGREIIVIKQMAKSIFKYMLSDGYIKLDKHVSSKENHYYFDCPTQ